MFALFAGINFVAVVLGAISNMVIGFLWYGPLFGKAWLAETGKTQMGGGSQGLAYGLTFVAALVQSFVLARFIKGLNAPGLLDGAIVGLFVAIGFVATSFASGNIFEGRSLKYYLINVGYLLVALVVMGAILAALP